MDTKCQIDGEDFVNFFLEKMNFTYVSTLESRLNEQVVYYKM